ncbi:hypothetical protein [Actinomadura sp. 6N118]|uniref:hypothetical protein n=1 Tax=Actinomadura sp. 6N118 TaxID=3375151 RepID=UPI003793CB1B
MDYHYVITLSDPSSGRSVTAYGVIPVSSPASRSQIFKERVTTIAAECGISPRPLVTFFSLEPDELPGAMRTAG